MESTIADVGKWAVSIVSLGIGFWLIIWAFIDLGGALGGKNKEWGKAILGIGIGILGGFLGWWGASNIISFFRSNGDEIPLG